jgi:hypothetical protein
MSNNLLIAIPSKGRAGLITSQKIFKSAVLFVPESEVSQYSIYSNEIIPVPGSVKGITATRNFILKSTDKDVFFVDDDVKSIGYYERTETKKKMNFMECHIL